MGRTMRPRALIACWKRYIQLEAFVNFNVPYTGLACHVYLFGSLLLSLLLYGAPSQFSDPAVWMSALGIASRARMRCSRHHDDLVL